MKYGGIFAALPDGVTASSFVLIWASPLVFGSLSVKTAMLTMLIEFFLVHATGFFTVLGGDGEASRLQRIAKLLGLSVFYVLMISAIAWSFQAWWLLLAFGWLLVGKVVWVIQNPKPNYGFTNRQIWAWAGSVVLFLAAMFLTTFADIPRWGIIIYDPEEGGLWGAEPQRVVAFGAVYFGLTFLMKLAIGWYDARKIISPVEGA